MNAREKELRSANPSRNAISDVDVRKPGQEILCTLSADGPFGKQSVLAYALSRKTLPERSARFTKISPIVPSPSRIRPFLPPAGKEAA